MTHSITQLFVILVGWQERITNWTHRISLLWKFFEELEALYLDTVEASSTTEILGGWALADYNEWYSW